MRLYFSGVLGATATDDGSWICPARTELPNELLVQIVGRLRQSGFEVVAEGVETDQALEHDLRRIRSFERARASARALMQLDDPASADAVVPNEQIVLTALREFGWNEHDRTLFPHQRTGLMHALAAVNAANFSVPGAGKTATALSIAATHLAQGTIDVVVVVGPLSSFRPWETEAGMALPGTVRTFRLRGLPRHARVERMRATQANDILLMSYQSVANDRDELERLCRQRKVMLVVDESHRVKSPDGQWSTAIAAVARYARVRLILSGTPMPQHAKDLWSQFTILWPGEELLGSRVSYNARADNNFDSVRDDIAPFMTRTSKDDLGLLPRITRTHPVELAPLQREVYELIADRLRQAIPHSQDQAAQLQALRRAQPIRLLQAASNPDLLNIEDGFYALPAMDDPDDAPVLDRLEQYRDRELPAKFVFALEFLQSIAERGDKCVVWTSFIRNIDQFAALVAERVGEPVFSVDGRVPMADGAGIDEEIDDTREQRIADFLNADGFAVLVANPAACAESISLHSQCHTALYLDRTYDCARWLQSIDRIHRLGLPDGIQVEIHVIEAVIDEHPTIDGLVDDSLHRKATRMERLLEGAELLSQNLRWQDTLRAAEGDAADLERMLRYLVGETS